MSGEKFDMEKQQQEASLHEYSKEKDSSPAPFDKKTDHGIYNMPIKRKKNSPILIISVVAVVLIIVGCIVAGGLYFVVFRAEPVSSQPVKTTSRPLGSETPPKAIPPVDQPESNPDQEDFVNLPEEASVPEEEEEAGAEIEEVEEEFEESKPDHEEGEESSVKGGSQESENENQDSGNKPKKNVPSGSEESTAVEEKDEPDAAKNVPGDNTEASKEENNGADQQTDQNLQDQSEGDEDDKDGEETTPIHSNEYPFFKDGDKERDFYYMIQRLQEDPRKTRKFILDELLKRQAELPSDHVAKKWSTDDMIKLVDLRKKLQRALVKVYGLEKLDEQFEISLDIERYVAKERENFDFKKEYRKHEFLVGKKGQLDALNGKVKSQQDSIDTLWKSIEEINGEIRDSFGEAFTDLVVQYRPGTDFALPSPCVSQANLEKDYEETAKKAKTLSSFHVLMSAKLAKCKEQLAFLDDYEAKSKAAQGVIFTVKWKDYDEELALKGAKCRKYLDDVSALSIPTALQADIENIEKDLAKVEAYLSHVADHMLEIRSRALIREELDEEASSPIIFKFSRSLSIDNYWPVPEIGIFMTEERLQMADAACTRASKTYEDAVEKRRIDEGNIDSRDFWWRYGYPKAQVDIEAAKLAMEEAQAKRNRVRLEGRTIWRCAAMDSKAFNELLDSETFFTCLLEGLKENPDGFKEMICDLQPDFCKFLNQIGLENASLPKYKEWKANKN